MSAAVGMLPTLRKKKTRKDMPRRISTYNGEPIDVSAKEKSKVQDRIKKRLSTKVGMPAMQSSSSVPLPTGALQTVNNANRMQIPRERQASTAATRPRAARPVYDPSVFDDPDFNAETYVKKMLATVTPAELDTFFQALQDSKDATNTALQSNVFHNYKEFIMISKEIGTLETDMTTIRGLLGELKGITTSLQDESITAATEEPEYLRSGSAGRRGARNSIVDFLQLNKSHLKALWAQVEGAQKFLPADEGRRIVRESGQWTELNVATWRPKEKVHMVLLNDHLLMAQRRPKPDGSGQRLIAQRCFHLSSIQMDTFQEEEMSTAIAIRPNVGGERFVYRAESIEERRAMMTAFMRESGELQSGSRQDDHEEDKRASLRAADTSRDGQIKRLSRRLSKTTTGSTDEIDLAHVRERVDELDRRIAHREYRDAVRIILRGRALVASASADDMAVQLTSLELDERRDRLARLLALELADNHARSAKVKDLVAYLVAIGCTTLAQRTFLEARTSGIKKRSAGVTFEGDIVLYLSDVALVHFTLIKNTTSIYAAAFTDAAAISALIAWAKEEVQQFVDLFVRQLYGHDKASQVYRDALDAVSRQIAVLRDVGLDLTFVVQTALTTR